MSEPLTHEALVEVVAAALWRRLPQGLRTAVTFDDLHEDWQDRFRGDARAALAAVAEMAGRALGTGAHALLTMEGSREDREQAASLLRAIAGGEG